MVNQATAAGVSMNAPSSAIIANPVLHDKSDNQYSLTGSPQATGEDRQVRYRDGTTTTQRQMIGTGMTYNDTGSFITYLPRQTDINGNIVPRADYVTGTVNMSAYPELAECQRLWPHQLNGKLLSLP